ncbi:Cof-type HAD-IIB family hydrolase [Azotosporobacter soli]|uniref:Cof-type HAD-IIB family hydrolase n=1 Tax=Azotosporobacter soli TaxID=3055040 RepID=UPI0031FE4406
MYKMLCLDIDGTLLNSRHQITEQTKAAIAKATQEKKIPVVLVSARMPKGMRFLAEELKLDAPMICYNGALTIGYNGKILDDLRIESQYVKEIYLRGKKQGASVSLYREDEWYSDEEDAWIRQEEEIVKIQATIGDCLPLLAMWGRQGCHKILCMGEPTKLIALKKELTELFGEKLNLSLSKPTYLEIIAKNAAKSVAISALIKQYKIDRSELMVIGDNYNDIDMIRYAGLGIAMGNAPDEVKLQAVAVTLSNEEDGVAHAIDTYLLC